MARYKRIEFVDDLDGQPIDPDDIMPVHLEVKFPGRPAVRYVLDLRAANVAALEADLARYTDRATPVLGKTAKHSTASRRLRRSPEQTHRIRQWAADNGYDIASRGRIPSNVITAFDTAHH